MFRLSDYWALGLLALIPYAFYLSRRSLADLSAWRRWLAFGLRSAAILLLVLALAEFELRWKVDRLCVIFALDVSSSIPEDEVKRAFEREKVHIQYSNVAVQVTGTKEKLRSKLWHIRVGRAYAAPKMNLVAVDRCPTCGGADYSTWDNGILIDKSRWDGSDIFRLHEDVVGLVVTARVRDIVEREGFTGATFIPAEEFKDPYPESRARRPI